MHCFPARIDLISVRRRDKLTALPRTVSIEEA